MRTCPKCRKRVPKNEEKCRYCDYRIPKKQVSAWQTGFSVLPVSAIQNVKPLSPSNRQGINEYEDE